MPRVNLGRDKRNDILRMTIDSGMARRGISNKKDLALAAGVNQNTFYYRYKHPETFTFGELKRILDILKIPDEEKAGIL